MAKSGGRGLFRATYEDVQLASLAKTLRGLEVDVSQDGEITDTSLDRCVPLPPPPADVELGHQGSVWRKNEHHYGPEA